MLEFIEPFTKGLKHLAFADRGRTLEIFVDRDSIGWGEDWQEKIWSSIQGATVFLPIVTRQYFDRPACREELFRFAGEAGRLGVDGLLLPVVIMGHWYVSGDSPDEAARIIYRHNYRNLRDAWLEGTRSPIWRRTLLRLAGELVEAVTAAEQRLGATRAIGAADEDDAPGAAEVGAALADYTDQARQLVASLAEPMRAFGEILAANPGTAHRVAAEIEPHGARFWAAAQRFESSTVQVDMIMRRYVRFLRDHRLTEQLAREREALDVADADVTPIEGMAEAVTDFLDRIRPLETVNAPLRGSVRPFRQGAVSTRNALGIVRTWPHILDH